MAGMAFTVVPAVSLMLVSAGPFSVLGGYFGWYYLRFLNKNRDQTVGDVSDEFALVILLPDFCTYVLQCLKFVTFGCPVSIANCIVNICCA